MCVSVQKDLALSQGLLYSNSPPVLTDGVCASVYWQTALMEDRECVCCVCEEDTMNRGHVKAMYSIRHTGRNLTDSMQHLLKVTWQQHKQSIN